MTDSAPKHSARRRWAAVTALALALVGLVAVVSFAAPGWQRLPSGLAAASAPWPAGEVRFLADTTATRADGSRAIEQQIFDEVLALIRGARRLIVADFFLFNAHAGRDRGEPWRRLSDELTDALVAQAAAHPDLAIVFITDPINDVYGALPSPHLTRLRAAGATVVVTDLEALRDSNPLWSIPWRTLARPFGDGPGRTLPNPLGEGRISLRAALRLLNFKANHRKTLVVDAGDDWAALVTSANPHDGSSAHGNVALRFRGPAALALLETERAAMAFSAERVPEAVERALAAPRRWATDHPPHQPEATLQVLTERAIKIAALRALAAAEPGDRVDLALFYFADRDLVHAVRAAHRRGAQVRLVLDPNKDAFGLEKNGVPNRPVAHELVRAGVPVRWADTRGEQFHAKLLHLVRADGASAELLLGSANWTRRNLDNFNLETNVLLRAAPEHPAIGAALAWFDAVWTNEGELRATLDYAAYADAAWHRRALYRWQEASGLGTF